MKKLLMIYWLLLGYAGWVLAQSRVIKGKVTDASTGDPLVMVNVQLNLLIHDGLQQDYQPGVSGDSEKTKVYL